MSTREKLFKVRLGMLALADELQDITLACKQAAMSDRQRSPRILSDQGWYKYDVLGSSLTKH